MIHALLEFLLLVVILGIIHCLLLGLQVRNEEVVTAKSRTTTIYFGKHFKFKRIYRRVE